MRTYEGMIEIDLAEFWEWVSKNYLPDTPDETAFGIPRVNRANSTIEIDYAGGGTNPHDWADKPKAIRQWDETDNENSQ